MATKKAPKKSGKVGDPDPDIGSGHGTKKPAKPSKTKK
jgi:hypothetical protein